MKLLPVVMLLASCAGAAPTPKDPAAAPAAATVEEVLIDDSHATPGGAFTVVVRAASQAQAPTGTFRGKPLPFWKAKDGSWAAIAGVDLDVPVGPAPLVLELGDPSAKRQWRRDVAVKFRQYKVQHVTVDDKYVHLSPADQARADQDSVELKAAYAGVGPVPLWTDGFQSPIPGATNAHFGDRREFNGVKKDPHSGADLPGAIGDPIKAAADGVVVLQKDLFYSGNTVIIDHGVGVFTVYCHMNEPGAAVGTSVRKGDLIGKVGKTGRVSGPHLHWAVKLRGARVDPFALVALPLASLAP